MSKKPSLDIVEESDDGGVEVTLTPPQARQFGGTDADPTDDETGETLFDDVDPRLRRLDRKSKKDDDGEGGDADESEFEELEDKDADIDEDDESDVDEEGGDTEDDDEPRGKAKNAKWERRLKREKRLRDENRKETAELRARLDASEARDAARASDEEFNKKSGEFTAKQKDLTSKLEAAIEAGDSKLQASLTVDLADVNGDLKAAKIIHEQAKESLKETADRKKSNQTIVAVKSGQWVRKHQRFDADKDFRAAVKGLDQAVAADGFNPETDEYYEELDRRVRKVYPDEYKGKRRAGDDRQRRRHPSELQENEGVRPRAKTKGNFEVRGGRVKLSRRQVENMQNFGLDPNNPNDVRDYVSNNL